MLYVNYISIKLEKRIKKFQPNHDWSYNNNTIMTNIMGLYNILLRYNRWEELYGKYWPFHRVIMKSLAIIKIPLFTKICWLLPHVRYYSKCFLCINSLNPLDNTRRSVFPSCGEGNGGSERLGRHWKVAQLISGGAGVLESAGNTIWAPGCLNEKYPRQVLGRLDQVGKCSGLSHWPKVLLANWEETHPYSVDVVVFLKRSK